MRYLFGIASIKKDLDCKKDGGYYGNVCGKCFHSEDLKRCGSCKVISYCSAEHQREDWFFHKNICKVLKSANEILTCPKNGTFEDFTNYRRRLTVYLKKNVAEYNNLLPFLEYSKFPWVCAFCYSNDNLHYECNICKVVVYCSLEHKNRDHQKHQSNCYGLKLAKEFDSVGWPHGFFFIKLNLIMNDMPYEIQDFPRDMMALSHILQNEIRVIRNKVEFISLTGFNDSFSAISSILYSLQKIDLLNAHEYISKPSTTSKTRRKNINKKIACLLAGNFNPLAQITNNSLVIHFVVAEKYEVYQDWLHQLSFLLRWIHNIDFIEIILIGNSLLNYEQPNFPFSDFSNIQYYPFPYQTLVNYLVKPDIVVLFNCDKKDVQECQDSNFQKSLLSHRDVPIIITSTKRNKLISFIDNLSQIEEIRVKLPVHNNPFAEKRPYREWDTKNMSVFYNNEYISVITKV